MFAIAGLGNPGSRYQNTRHNVGFMLVDRLAQSSGGSFRQSLRHSLTCKAEIAGEPVVLSKPQTYMNRSGVAVVELMQWFPVEVSDLLIISDDIALPLGTVRMRPSGSSGGHNGLKSIITELGSQDFARLRIGIAGAGQEGILSDYVLASFKKEEQELLEQGLERAESAVETMIRDGISRAMALFN